MILVSTSFVFAAFLITLSEKRLSYNWPCNLIFELLWTLAIHCIYGATHCNSIATLSKQLIFNDYAILL
jgi:hypothetical protein